MGLAVEAGDGQERVQREYAKKGPRPAILSSIVDLGVQPQEYNKEKQRDCREFLPIFTLANDMYTDDDGVKHHMVTSPWPIKIKLGEKSNYTKFTKQLDPDGLILKDGVGDISKLIGSKCFVTMEHTEKDGITYANMKGVQEIAEDYPFPEVDYKTIIFDTDNPDPDVWEVLWDRTQNTIKEGVNYNEEEFQAKMAAYKAANETTSPDNFDDFDEDIPFNKEGA